MEYKGNDTLELKILVDKLVPSFFINGEEVDRVSKFNFSFDIKNGVPYINIERPFHPCAFCHDKESLSGWTDYMRQNFATDYGNKEK